MAARLRRRVNQVFPTHWTQLIAGITAASLVVLILTGVYLALYFDPSMAGTRYDGPFDNLRGMDMTRAYASVLHIAFEVRGGLLIRQIHNWAASLFLASLLVNLCVAFFTGGFRRPRRLLWTVTVLLLVTGVFAAFTGVLLTGDLLSDTSLRMISGYVLSVPVVGTWLHWTVFGGEFPGTEIIPRLYAVHLALTAILIGLLVLRTTLQRRIGPAQFRGHRRTEHNIVGVRLMPGFAPRLATAFLATIGVLALMGGLFQVNPSWNYGPGNPAHVSAGSAAPWYFGWVDGAVRLFPAWEIHLGDYVIPPSFWPSMVFLPLSFLALALYPRLEQRFTRDDAPHNLLQRPRDVPQRTALGVAVLAFYGCLQLAAAIDVLAFRFDLSADTMLWTARVAVVVLPPLAFAATYRLCLGLRLHDRQILEHGIPTGVIKRLPHGEFVDVRQPLGGPITLEYRGIPVPKKANKVGAAGRPVAGSLHRPDPPD
ncbi:MAG TPA: cytochrome b N-terminal domain-containing protein [Actinophytocola sp.]|jgi:ubiquinol-cytochrome c reductase cytochrome b subunit|uniref:cytochrome bc1 complex cytochrome b subunit n=1 Tax=Actinophytocola sp. TaxID=1872138 RepID=UPI002F9318CD